MDALAPILNQRFEGDRQMFTLDPTPSNAFSYSTEDGYQTFVEPTKIIVSFAHRLKARPTSAGPPVAELISRAAPYTQLLDTVLRQLIATTLLLPGPAQRGVRRIGIVSQSAVAEDELPPGVLKFIDHIARPWRMAPHAFGFNITTNLATTRAWQDRCIHTLTKTEGADNLVNLSFDWQRTFDGTGVNTRSQNGLEDIVRSAQQAALTYFEELAEGNRFDADIVSDKP